MSWFTRIDSIELICLQVWVGALAAGGAYAAWEPLENVCSPIQKYLLLPLQLTSSCFEMPAAGHLVSCDVISSSVPHWTAGRCQYTLGRQGSAQLTEDTGRGRAGR